MLFLCFYTLCYPCGVTINDDDYDYTLGIAIAKTPIFKLSSTWSRMHYVFGLSVCLCVRSYTSASMLGRWHSAIDLRRLLEFFCKIKIHRNGGGFSA